MEAAAAAPTECNALTASSAGTDGAMGASVNAIAMTISPARPAAASDSPVDVLMRECGACAAAQLRYGSAEHNSWRLTHAPHQPSAVAV